MAKCMYSIGSIQQFTEPRAYQDYRFPGMLIIDAKTKIQSLGRQQNSEIENDASCLRAKRSTGYGVVVSKSHQVRSTLILPVRIRMHITGSLFWALSLSVQPEATEYFAAMDGIAQLFSIRSDSSICTWHCHPSFPSGSDLQD